MSFPYHEINIYCIYLYRNNDGGSVTVQTKPCMLKSIKQMAVYFHILCKSLKFFFFFWVGYRKFPLPHYVGLAFCYKIITLKTWLRDLISISLGINHLYLIITSITWHYIILIILTINILALIAQLHFIASVFEVWRQFNSINNQLKWGWCIMNLKPHPVYSNNKEDTHDRMF